MTYQIFLSVATIAIIVVVIFLVMTLVKTMKAVSQIQADLHRLSFEAMKIIIKGEEITADVQKKFAATSAFFSSFKFINKNLLHLGEERNGSEHTSPSFLTWVTRGFMLAKTAQEFIKNHGK